MPLTLALDTLLQNITNLAGAISGIRHAYNYDEWPDSPPGLFNKDQAMHLTGYPEEGDGWVYRLDGIDLDEYIIVIPLYTVVIAAAQVKRSRAWVAQYLDSYPAKFRANIQLSGAITSGAAIYRGGRVVRSIPDWTGYDGFYMLRHELELHVKGHATHTA
jgi:hypothetical protein